MSSMLRKTDTLFGHVIDDTERGPVYRDDGSPVDFSNPRSCLGCKVNIAHGTHDPCIAGLPGTYQACCGHGLDRSPVSDSPNGYVALKDGRTIRFSGCLGGERIREAVQTVLAGSALPDGFVLDEERAWWEGLTDSQRAYVQERIPQGIARLVRELTNGEQSGDLFLQGKQPWWEGLSDEQKGQVWNSMRRMLFELVQEALTSVIS